MTPTERAHLRHIQSIREGRAKPRKMDWCATQLSIPMSDYRVLVKVNPELEAGDPTVKHKAWQEFLASQASAPYKLNKRDGHRRMKR